MYNEVKKVKALMIHKKNPLIVNEGTEYEKRFYDFLDCYCGTTITDEMVKEANEKRIQLGHDEFEDGDYYYTKITDDFGFNHE